MRRTLIVIACTLGAVTAASAEEKCAPLQRVASVNIDENKSGGALVPVSIAGQPFTFRLATSGSQSMISNAAAVQLGLPRHASSVNVINNRGTVGNTVAVATDFRIGTLRFASAELRELLEEPSPNAPQGMLAADLLRNYDVDLDFGGGKMNLISREHCADKVVYWPAKALAKVPMRVDEDNRIIFHATLDGHEIEATIETSAPRTILTKPVAKEVFGLDETSPGARPGSGERFRYRFGTLSVNGVVVKNPDIMVLPDAVEHMHKHGQNRMDASARVHQAAPLRLGMSTLRQLHVYIDYRNLTLYVTPAKPETDDTTEPAGE